MEWWKLTAVKPRAIPAFISTRCNQQALEAGGVLQFGDMSAGQTDREFRAVSITESSRNLVCSCLRYFLGRSVDFGFAWNLLTTFGERQASKR